MSEWGEAVRRDGDRVSLWWRQALGSGQPYDGVQRPVVPVKLTVPGTGRFVERSALLDTGADFTQATTALLPELGIEHGDCEAEIGAFNSMHSALTLRHPIDLEIAEAFTIRFDSMQFRDFGALNADSGDKWGWNLLLGSNDVLRFLKATLDYGELHLEPREPGVTEWEMPHDVLEPAA